MQGHFIWADVSSYTPASMRPFYEHVMGWQFDDYIASTPSGPVAGLFEMPEFFVKIGMPSFWMSYIKVGDIAQTIAIATEQGGKVELGPETMGQGQYALIRDPLGAGFTVYEGDGLDGSAGGAFSRLGHALFVSNAKAVHSFYEAVFGWRFGAQKNSVQAIYSPTGLIAHLHEIPDPSVRGKEEYWGVLFACPNLDAAADRVRAAGGSVQARFELPEGHAMLCTDPDNAVFILVSKDQIKMSTHVPRRAWLGVGILLLSIATDWAWIWALFWIVWVVAGLRDQETWLFEKVTRRQSPGLYWIILALYTLFGVFSVFGFS